MNEEELNKDLISVIMPVYNSEKYLSIAIESILKQTYKNIEFIIIDDCSTDNSLEIIKSYAKLDKRIKIFKKNKNSGGCTKPINLGIKKSKGKFIARMDADDISELDRLNLQLNYLKKTNSDICSTNLTFIDEKGKSFLNRIYDISKFENNILLESPIAHATILAKKQIFEKYGYFDEQFDTAQDYDLWLRLWAKKCKFSILNKYLYHYRQHESSGKTLKTKKTIKNVLKIKFKAMKEYNIKFGIKGWIRISQEILLLLLPSFIIKKVFFIYIKLKNE